jgi:TPR repeat protein
MSDQHPLPLRFTSTLVLSMVCLAVPAWADYQAGMNAYNSGDHATALREWRTLAEQGDADAQVNLGVLYDNGQGVPKDYKTAVYWFRLSANQGNAMAQSKLGLMYERGNGVPQDVVLAQKWYILGAANGDKQGAELRDALAKQMTPAQIFQAQQRALERMPKDKRTTNAKRREHVH